MLRPGPVALAPLFVLSTPPERIQAAKESHHKLPRGEGKEPPFGARQDRVQILTLHLLSTVTLHGSRPPLPQRPQSQIEMVVSPIRASCVDYTESCV